MTCVQSRGVQGMWPPPGAGDRQDPPHPPEPPGGTALPAAGLRASGLRAVRMCFRVSSPGVVELVTAAPGARASLAPSEPLQSSSGCDESRASLVHFRFPFPTGTQASEARRGDNLQVDSHPLVPTPLSVWVALHLVSLGCTWCHWAPPGRPRRRLVAQGRLPRAQSAGGDPAPAGTICGLERQGPKDGTGPYPLPLPHESLGSDTSALGSQPGTFASGR